MEKKKKVVTTLLAIGISLLVFLLVFLLCSLPILQTTYHTIETKKVNDEIKIVVLADFHSSQYGKNQSDLVNEIKAQNPDLILMPGDIVDDVRDKKPCTVLFNQLKTVAPMYYIYGNHEMKWNVKQEITDFLLSFGVNIVNNTYLDVKVKNTTLRIFGLQDPQDKIPPDTWLKAINVFSNQVDDKYAILLSHRPTFVEEYKKTNFDLILCGHAHGGQWRFPWSEQGIFCSDEGLFPKYTSGRFNLGNPTMLVSRGLCKNFVPRFFNRPEILSVTIKPQNAK